MIPILILAGGRSRRMQGRDKLLEPVVGQPLLRLVARRACDTGQQVFVALPVGSAARQDALSDLPVTALILPEAAEGMSGTMRAGVAALPPCPAFLLVLSDLPEITTQDMQTIIGARNTHPGHLIWRGATRAGKPGHPILFDEALRPEFTKLSGDGGGESLVDPLRARTHLIPFDTDRARLDLDTPQDWANWRSRPPMPKDGTSRPD